MGLFSRRDKIVDLTEDYRQQRKVRTKEGSEVASPGNAPAKSQESSSGGFFNFFGNVNSSSSSNTPSSSSSDSQNSSYSGNFDPETGKPLDASEKRRRLARRLKDMTDRIEDLSNQVYLLQQRIELLERRNKASREEL